MVSGVLGVADASVTAAATDVETGVPAKASADADGVGPPSLGRLRCIIRTGRTGTGAAATAPGSSGPAATLAFGLPLLPALAHSLTGTGGLGGVTRHRACALHVEPACVRRRCMQPGRRQHRRRRRTRRFGAS